MPPTNERQDLRDAAVTVWRRQSVWSRAAGRTKRRVLVCRAWVLGLTVAAAVLGTASAQASRSQPTVAKVLAVAAAVALALAPMIAARAGRDAVQAWTQLRSVAETIKAEVFRYLAGVPPFHGPDRDRVLLRRWEMAEREAGPLTVRTTGITPEDRALPPVRDVESYLEHRVDRQVAGYYRPAALRMARQAATVRWTASVLSGAAAALTAVSGLFGGATVVAWVGVLTTVVTALATYGASQRYEYQHLELSRTANQLERLRAAWSRGDAGDDSVVDESERVISISNSGWMAELTAPKG